ncbi:MAG: hypothetical protein K2O33_00660 [Muribaculaceae bacterium]|nr:hypothetical protein [Muribaculaceae bacterium]
MPQTIINIDSVDAYNKLYGLPTLHPLVTVVDLKQARYPAPSARYRYGLYALFLKNGVTCSISYGRKQYDYQEGTVVSFAPGQQVDIEVPEGEVTHDVTGLLFHPDLIYGTSLAHGATASRPGMAASNILQRELDNEFINLGFSANGKLDYEIAEMMASVDDDAYIIENIHKSTVAEIYNKT